MEGKSRQIEKYQDFLINRRKYNNSRLNEEKENFENISNKTEPCFNLKNLNRINPIGPGYQPLFKRKLKKSKEKNKNIHQKLKNIYKELNSNEFQSKYNNNLNPSKINKISQYINEYKKKCDNKNNNNKKTDKNPVKQRAFSANNLMKKNINNNYNKNNNYILKYKNNSLNNNQTRLSFDGPSLNKELEHLLTSYDFKNDINDKSIKIHFRNLLYLVKELQAKNDLLKKEIRNKNNLISSLEKQINSKNNSKNRINNEILKEYNDNVLLDNNVLKSEILNLEKQLMEQKSHYEDLLNDYKNKLNVEKENNDILNNNMKYFENQYRLSNDKIIDIKKELKDTIMLKTRLEDKSDKYETINKEQQKRIENLENQLRLVLTLVKNLFNKENNSLYQMRTKLFNDLSNLGLNL